MGEWRSTGRRATAGLIALTMTAALLVVGLDPAPAGATGAAIQAPTGPVASAALSSTSPTAVLDDPVHRHVFVADGVNTIQVFDYDANPVATITNVGAVNGMVLNAGTIYATNGNAALIERIDTTTLTRGTNLTTSVANPRTPVVISGYLWVGSGECYSNVAKFTRVDLVTGAAVDSAPADPYCTVVAGDAAQQGKLLVASRGLSSTTTQLFDVSTGAPSNPKTGGGPDLSQMVLDPDGQHWYTASGAPYGIERWRTSDMLDLGVAFPTNAYPTAVAVTGANGGFVAGGMYSPYEADVTVFDSHDVLTKRFSHDFGLSDDNIRSNGLAFSGDGSRLFTVAKGGLRIFALPGVAGRVASLAGAPQPGVKVEAVATSGGAVIGSGTTDENGWFAIGRAPFTPDQTYQLRYTEPLSGGVMWLGANGLPVAQASALTFTFSPDRGQPANLSASLLGAAYHPVTPTRLVDTRDGTGTTPGPMEPFELLGITVPGGGGVIPESGVSAVVLNVTAVSPESGGYITLWPAGADVPPTSNLNYATGVTEPNLVTVGLGTDGVVLLGNAYGRTDVIVDVAGWFDDGSGVAGGTAYHPLTPTRVVDTRTGTGGFSGPLGGGQSIDVLMKDNGSGVPAGNVTAVVLNVTVTDTTTGGYLTVSPSGGQRPLASNLNWNAGVTVPNMVIAKPSADGHLNIFNSQGNTNVIVDVVGWFDDGTTTAGTGGLFHPVTPDRVLDTRDGTGAPAAKVGQGQSINVHFAGAGGVPASGASAVLVNTTVTNTTSWGFLTVWPDGVNRPTASNLNWVQGQTIPNLVLTPLSPTGWARVYNANGSTDVIGDVAGWFDTP